MQSERRHSRSFVWFFALVVGVLGVAFMFNVPSTPALGGERDDDVIHEHMMGMKKSLKRLASTVQDAANDEQTLQLIHQMQQHMMAVKLEDPPVLADAPVAKQDKLRRNFRKDAAKMVIELLEMEIDVLKGRHKKAFGRISGSLFRGREAAHKKYQKKD